MHNIKKHKQTTNTDPLQRRSNISLYPAGYGGWSQKLQNDQKKFEQTSKAFETLKTLNNSVKQGGSTGNGASGVLNTASSIISPLTSGFKSMNTSVNPTSLSIRDSISDAAIQSGNPYAMAIGAATKVLDAIGDATGFHLDDIDKTAGNRAGVNGGAIFLNNAMNALPGMSITMATFGSGKTGEAIDLNDAGSSVAAAYSGSQNDINASKKLAGKRTLLGIGTGKMNDFIQNANSQVSIINEIGRTNSLAKKSDYNTNLAQQNLNRYAGTNYQTYAVGKNGMKIMSRKELQDILATRKLQKGGVIGTDTSILPEGALHARLNHLQGTNPDLEDTTRKGIPVLDAKGNQVAEVEKEELVLRLEITKKLEELMKDGSEDAMIEAGKILTYELIKNTQDNTGQITEEVENGK